MAPWLPDRDVSHGMDTSILPDLSDLNDTDDEVDAVLLSLSNPWSDESEGNCDWSHS